MCKRLTSTLRKAVVVELRRVDPQPGGTSSTRLTTVADLHPLDKAVMVDVCPSSTLASSSTVAKKYTARVMLASEYLYR